MAKYNKDISKLLRNHKRKPSNRIDWIKLNSGKLYHVILIEMYARDNLSYLEKWFQVLILNIERNRLSKLIEENEQFYNNEISYYTSKLNKTALEEIKESEEDNANIAQGEDVNEVAYSNYLSASRSRSNSHSQGYSSNCDSMYTSSDSIDNSSELYHPANAPQINVYPGFSNSVSAPIDTKLKDKKKSKFNNKSGTFKNSSKRLISELSRKPGGKYMPRYDQEVTPFGFIKGANTAPLVSELLAWSDRNNNIGEVYERLKFFTLQCLYHSNSDNEMKYLRILKEIDLYLKSYEDENEDSDWDSDEECGVIAIAKDLKIAIEEKTSLTNEISAVEIDLLASNSNTSRERLNSTLTNSVDGTLLSPTLQQKLSNDIPFTKKPTEESISLDNNNKSLYKNVLSKGSTSSSPTKVQTKCGSLVINKAFSECLEEPNKSPNTPGTPTLTKESEPNTARLPRRFASNSSFNQRSSSIHSIKSSKGAANKKRYTKKKSNGLGSAKKFIKDKGKKYDDSNESSRSESSSQRSHSYSKSDKSKSRLDEDPKLGKGLSSFAKIKDSKKKKRKVKRVKTHNHQKSSRNQTASVGIKVSIEQDPNTSHKQPDNTPKKIPPQLSKADLPPKSPILKKNSNKEIHNLGYSKGDFEKQTRRQSIEDINLLRPEGNVKKLGNKNKREMFQKQRLKSVVNNEVKDFVNIFNSFGEESFIHKRRKSRQQSTNSFKKETQLIESKDFSSTLIKRSKFLSTKDDYLLKINSDKSICLIKERARSLWNIKINQNQSDSEDVVRYARRTLSDFHELVKARINITTEMYTGVRQKSKEIDTKKQRDPSDSSLDRWSNSVSDKSSEESKDREESEEESEDSHGMVRFYSLPILPSEKESLVIHFDDEFDTLHKTGYNKTNIDDFILLRAVSHGAYGKVWLARKKQTRDLFAIKVMDKIKMEEKGVTQQVINERDILNKVNNNCVVRGVYTFQTSKFLYIVMEYMKGGDFAGLLENIKAFDENAARIYLAQLVLAIEYLHSIDIIHRDLKPDNILIDGEGMIKLTDFGLSEINLKHIKEQYTKTMNKGGNQLVVLDSSDSDSDCAPPMDLNMALLGKESIQKRKKALKNKIKITQNLESIRNKKLSAKAENKKILGTPDYIAPEVIQGKEVTKAVDWWAVGVIAFEFLTGNLPFNDDSPEKIFDNIIKKNIKWPPQVVDELSKEAVDFIKRWIDYDVAKRLGSNGAEEVKNHPFFESIKWDQMDDIHPPFIPQVDNEIDTTFFSDAKKQFNLKELEDIQNDMNSYSNQQFEKFDSTVVDTLAEINKKEAKKAILKASSLSKYRSEVQDQSSQKIDLEDSGYEFDSMFSCKK